MPKQRSKRSTGPPPSKPAPARRTSTTSSPRTWIAVLLLALSIGTVYGRSLAVPLIFDDIYSIVENESIRSLWPLVGTAEHPGPLRPDQQLPTAARPLVNYSFALNYSWGGSNPVGYHAINVLIHFVSAVAIFLIVRRTLLLTYFGERYDHTAGWLALAAALIWALHPLQTETVIYATQRTELMFALFYLTTLYCSLRYWSCEPTASSRSMWLVLAIAACLAGMASKEVMVSAPLMILLFDRTFISGSLQKTLRQSWPLYAGLAGTLLLLFGLLLGSPHSESVGFGIGTTAYEWWLTQSKVFWMYLKLAIFPWPLLIHYQPPYFHSLIDSWMYVLPTLFLGLGVLWLLWRNHPIGYLGTWVLAILSPTFVIPIVTEIAAERRMYLPLAALVVLFVVGLYSLAQRLKARRAHQQKSPITGRPSIAFFMAPLLVLSIVCGAASAWRLRGYSDDINLWRDVLRVYPQDNVALYNLGSQLLTSGQLPEAVDVLLCAHSLQPDNADVLNNLSVALIRSHRFDEGITYLKRALRLQPNLFDLHLNLGLIYTRTGHSAEAIEELQAALKLKPGDSPSQSLLGLALYQAGRHPEAIEVLERQLKEQPDSVEDRNHLATALAHNGDPIRAMEEYRTALKVDPSDVEAAYNLALLLTAAGQANEAAAHFERILKVRPNMAEFHNGYADLLRTQNQLPMAIEHYRAAIRIQPALAAAYLNLAQLLAADQPAEAVAVAKQGIAAARSSKQHAAAEGLEEWLKHYENELRRQSSAAAGPGSP